MRIALVECYLKPTPDYGVIAQLLRQRGHSVWLGTTNADNDLVWQDGRQIVAIQPRRLQLPSALAILRKLPFFRRFENLWFIVRLRRFLRQQEIEVVQLNTATLDWVGLIPLLMPMAFVLDWRQISQREVAGRLGALKNWLADRRRFFYSTALYDCATFLHTAGAEKVLGKDWRRWGKVVPLGVDQSFLQRTDSQRTGRVERGKASFLYIGTLSRVRRLERLLEAAQAMLPVSRDFQIDFVGPDTANGYYQQLVQQLALDDVVAFYPPVPYTEVPGTILDYDVALAYVPEYPLDWQYHPTLKIIEYRALGVPVIATDFAPNRELVVEGGNGLLVENRPEALAEAMLRFVQDRAFLADCWDHAQKMRQGTPWHEIVELYEQSVYLPLVEKQSRPGQPVRAVVEHGD